MVNYVHESDVHASTQVSASKSSARPHMGTWRFMGLSNYF